ncbi:MAG: hypothetical protein IKV64_03530 [Clostridia bacterium]|nr:hypothetical protein [Clostridia bacterium]
MAKNNKKNGSKDSILNIIIAIVMVAVIGVSIYAIYTTASTKIIKSRIESGETEPNLSYMAESAGLSVDEFLNQYGLENAGLSKNSSQTEVTDKMTLTNFATYSGTTVEDILKQYYLEDKANGDTLYADFKAMWTVKSMVGGDEESFKQVKEYYGLDDSITMDTPWSEVEPVIEEKTKEMQNATPAPTQTADEATPEESNTEESTADEQ